jgi:hypothetical protein
MHHTVTIFLLLLLLSLTELEEKGINQKMTDIVASSLRRCTNAITFDRSEAWDTLKQVLRKNWHLGLTAFGGPPVHFQIVRNYYPINSY